MDSHSEVESDVRLFSLPLCLTDFILKMENPITYGDLSRRHTADMIQLTDEGSSSSALFLLSAGMRRWR